MEVRGGEELDAPPRNNDVILRPAKNSHPRQGRQRVHVPFTEMPRVVVEATLAPLGPSPPSFPPSPHGHDHDWTLGAPTITYLHYTTGYNDHTTMEQLQHKPCTSSY